MSQQTSKPTDSSVQIEGFEHVPGKHCGSTALTDLLRFYGLELPEAVVFGLAAGAAFFYVQLPGMSPSRTMNGRAAKLEEQFIELAGGAFTLEKEEDPVKSWQIAKEKVDSGNPTLLLTDLYYLDHYDNSAHFPGHAVVLTGYDLKTVYLADTDFDEIVAVPHESLSKARHSPAQPFPLKGEVVTATDRSAIEDLRTRLPEVAQAAIKMASRNMLEPPYGDLQGIKALQKLADEVTSWPKEAEDWQWCARFSYQVIERRGTGGGNFRKLYSEFLKFVDDQGIADVGNAADLCAEAADLWTELADEFKLASKSDYDDALWKNIAQASADLASREERLWTELASK